MKKFERLAQQAIAQAGAVIVGRKKIGGHARLLLRLPSGAERKLVISSSPANEDHALLAIAKEAARLVAAHSPTHSARKATMKLYKTSYTVLVNNVPTRKAVWHSNADDASKARTALKAKDRASLPESVSVEVPTTRADLLVFLNALTD